MFTNSVIRQMNQQSRELRALKSRQTIPGDSVQTQSYRNEFHQTITVGNVANASAGTVGCTVYAHAVDIKTGEPKSQPGLFNANIQVKQSGHDWTDPIPQFSPDGEGALEQRWTQTKLEGNQMQIALYVLNGGDLVGDENQGYHGELTTRGFQTSIISVGDTGWVIDRMVGQITYYVTYPGHSGEQTVNFDYT